MALSPDTVHNISVAQMEAAETQEGTLDEAPYDSEPVRRLTFSYRKRTLTHNARVSVLYHLHEVLVHLHKLLPDLQRPIPIK